MERFFVALERRKEKKKGEAQRRDFLVGGEGYPACEGCEALTVHHSCVGEGKITPFLQVSAGSPFFPPLEELLRYCLLFFPYFFFLLK